MDAKTYNKMLKTLLEYQRSVDVEIDNTQERIYALENLGNNFQEAIDTLEQEIEIEEEK